MGNMVFVFGGNLSRLSFQVVMNFFLHFMTVREIMSRAMDIYYAISVWRSNKQIAAQ